MSKNDLDSQQNDKHRNESLSSISGFFIAISAICSSFFYFTGASYNFLISKGVGFPEPISNLTIQETISLGVGISVIPLFILVILYVIIFLFLRNIPNNIKIIKFSEKFKFRYIASFVGAFFGLFLAIGSLQSSIELKRVRQNIDGKCELCRNFKTEDSLFIGMAIAKDAERIYVATKSGIEIIKLDELSSVSRSKVKKGHMSFLRYII